MALTGESPFEDLLLQNLKDINSKIDNLDINQKNTCSRMDKLETKWDTAVDQKIKAGDKKYRFATIFVTAFAGISWIWNLVPHK